MHEKWIQGPIFQIGSVFAAAGVGMQLKAATESLKSESRKNLTEILTWKGGNF